eukprot:2943892-Alexandrium_andersonii.AAC.2
MSDGAAVPQSARPWTCSRSNAMLPISGAKLSCVDSMETLSQQAAKCCSQCRRRVVIASMRQARARPCPAVQRHRA